jgi:hypothetical protein
MGLRDDNKAKDATSVWKSESGRAILVAFSWSIRDLRKRSGNGCARIADFELREEVFGLFQQTLL